MDNQSPLRGVRAVLLLADESAHLVLGGLTQVNRLLYSVQECCITPPASNTRPLPVMVWWRNAALRAGYQSPGVADPPLLSVVHWSGDLPPDGGALVGGGLAVLRTTLVVGRGALGPLLQANDEAWRGLPLHHAALPDPTLRTWSDWAQVVDSPASPEGGRRPGPGFAAVLRGPEDLAGVERGLLRSLGKSSDGYVARTLNRAVSTRITGLLARTRITPDRVSLGVLGLALGAAWTVTLGSPIGFVAGCLLNQLASMFDGCDGELARLKFLDTRRGAWLDTSIDMLGNHLFLLGMGIGLSRQPGLSQAAQGAYLWEGILATGAFALCLWLVAWLTRQTSGEPHFNAFGSNLALGTGFGNPIRRVVAALTPIFRRDVYALVFLGMALMGRPAWILHGLAFGVMAHVPVIAWFWWQRHDLTLQVSTERGRLNG